MKRIDINADVGESFGRWTLGNDAEVMRFVSSANIACGLHAGDWNVMERTISLAAANNVAVGAHPSYPDLQGFGRRSMNMAPDEITRLVLFQLGALWAIARSCGVEISHVKPHGALYNDAMRDASLANAIARAVKLFSNALLVYCLPGSCLEDASKEVGLRTCAEGFADRLYEPSGLLAERHTDGAVLSIEAAAKQGLSLATGKVTPRASTTIDLVVETICIHGDAPSAPATARALRSVLEEAGIAIIAPGHASDT